MSVQDNWIENLKAIVDAEAPGPKKRPGYRAVATATGLDEEYVYQLYTGRKPTLGHEAARAIARAYANGRRESWFDQPPVRGGRPSPAAVSAAIVRAELTKAGNAAAHGQSGESPLMAAAMVFARRLLEADEITRESVAPLLSRLAKSPEESDRIAGMIEALIDQSRSSSMPEDGEPSEETVDVPITSGRPHAGRSVQREHVASRQVTINPLPNVKRKKRS